MNLVPFRRRRSEGTTALAPFEDINQFLNRMFNWWDTGLSDPYGTWWPALDIAEREGEILVRAEVPGLRSEDIDVSVHDGVLSISGEKKVEKEENDADYHHVERSYGCFARNISLPDSVDTEKVESTYKNGILTVTIPKNEKAIEHSRKIPVTPA